MIFNWMKGIQLDEQTIHEEQSSLQCFGGHGSGGGCLCLILLLSVNFKTGSGFEDKTPWDWLDLFLVAMRLIASFLSRILFSDEGLKAAGNIRG